MTHFLGPVVPDGSIFNHTAGLDFTPRAGMLGGPRFVILHFDSVSLGPGAQLTVPLGYGTDIFTAASGSNFWSRPVDPSIAPIAIRIVGGTGSARLREFGAGEPSVTPGQPPGTSQGSQSNPDVFLHTSPYEEPIYETRLECNPGFGWRNAACSLPMISDMVRNQVAAATGIIVEVHGGHVSSCSGTLIAADLYLTARHCLNDASGEDLRSSSVSFEYATACDGTKPAGHTTTFFKVIEEVAAGQAPGIDGQPPTANDWVVVRLDAAPGALPPPLPMRDAALMNGETIFTMHHPNGAAKKTQSGVHDGGSISGFDYAGGSSGSALFDTQGRLVGGPLANGFGCGVSYAPIANVKSGLTNPPPPPAPLDVMIVFDRSGSMNSSAPPIGRPKLQEAQDAVSLFVRLVREGAGDRLGMVTFSASASVPTTIGPADTKKVELVGSSPFTGGDVGGITASGSTSIGRGLETGVSEFGASVGNDRAILLLSDGLQNTNPMVAAVEHMLAGIKLNVIGFGSDAQIDGPLLSRLARQHSGHFTRAVDGLALRKFFGLSFGNIFETGALSDPDYLLRASQDESDPHYFSVCGEKQITVVIGWDNPPNRLRAFIRTPTGQPFEGRSTQGRTWIFYKIPLPYRGDQDGTWSFTIKRTAQGPNAPPPMNVRYFAMVICDGGPKLSYLGGPKRVYTGDPIDSLVGLHYRNRTTLHANVELTITAPGVALGQLVTDAPPLGPTSSADPVGAFHATLQSIEKEGVLPTKPYTITVPLYDDAAHDDGALEPDGIYNNRLKDLTKVEGTYEFRAVATFGEGCTATREAFWSIHVEPGIEPGQSGVKLTDVASVPEGRQGTLVITPRDVYGNPLGPFRGDRFTVSPSTGVKVTGKVNDNGDGSYSVYIAWDPAVVQTPGVILSQPDRKPVPITPGGDQLEPPPKDCTKPATELLDCLGLKNPDAKSIRVKSVCLEIKLKDDDDCGDC